MGRRLRLHGDRELAPPAHSFTFCSFILITILINDCDVLICESLSSCTYCAPSDPVRDPPTNPDRQLSTTVVILLLHLIFDLSPSPPSTQARKNGSRNTQEAAHALSQ